MSAKNNVVKFYEKVEQDKALQAKLTDRYLQIIEESRRKLAAEVVKLAALEGFQFTEQEWNEERKAKAQTAVNTELGKATCLATCDYTNYKFCMEQHTCFDNWY